MQPQLHCNGRDYRDGSVVTFTSVHIVVTVMLCGALVFAAGMWMAVNVGTI
jgi:hypothetical protein